MMTYYGFERMVTYTEYYEKFKKYEPERLDSEFGRIFDKLKNMSEEKWKNPRGEFTEYLRRNSELILALIDTCIQNRRATYFYKICFILSELLEDLNGDGNEEYLSTEIRNIVWRSHIYLKHIWYENQEILDCLWPLSISNSYVIRYGKTRSTFSAKRTFEIQDLVLFPGAGGYV
jgi:hypothetical protein